MDWLLSNFLGGIRLWVRPNDLEVSERLDQVWIEAFDFDVEGVGEYRQPRCPTCESLDLSFQELNRKVAYGSIFLCWLLFGVLVPLKRAGWKCHTCGHA
jgi:hypothetical protein